MDQDLSVDLSLTDEASEPYVGQWQRLVSSTNWQKGRIIHEWRTALLEAGASSYQYSDEAWSERVGRSVSGQHVGRLRRVYERFFAEHEKYPGLFWSHFQAALDWNDAEMWLAGAAQSEWSISELREQRARTLGEVAEAAPPLRETDFGDEEDTGDAPTNRLREVRDVEGEDVSQANEALADAASTEAGMPFAFDDSQPSDVPPPVRPFENLADLPADLADAFESYKLAILRHKVAGWVEISRSDVLASLDALKELALASS